MTKIIDAIFKTKIRAGVTLFAVISIAIAFAIGPYYRVMFIRGFSMEPTISHHQVVIVKRRVPAMRGDIVVVRDRGTGEQLAKRVIGLPGEIIEVREGVIYINNKKVPNVYGTGRIQFNTPIPRPISHYPEEIPKKHIWVIGDNWKESAYGLFPLVDVEGVIVWY